MRLFHEVTKWAQEIQGPLKCKGKHEASHHETSCGFNTMTYASTITQFNDCRSEKIDVFVF